jgi:hypothetical protein
MILGLPPLHRPALLLAALAATPLATAQETLNYASLSGQVADQSGAAIEGALVTARQAATNRTSATHTDREGRFRLVYLKVGRYELTVRQAGFDGASRIVTLTVGSAFDLPFTLAVSSVDTNILVAAESATLEAARSQIAGTVSQTEIGALPLNGRNFLDLALLVPGVSPTNTASNQLFPETSAVPGQGISMSSQRNFSNNFIVDGLSANDDAAGLSGIFYGLDVVEEFQVVTSGGHAEYGRAMGGFVNVVTRSGTNSLHGGLYNYFRNQRLNAANPLSQSKVPLTQEQYGASAGGPLIHDRTFYFGNFEQRRLQQSGLTTITPASVAAINARLAAVAYPGAPVATGLYPNPVRSTNALAKLDHLAGRRNQASLRYSLYRAASANSRGAGGLNSVTSSAGLDNTDQTIAAGNVATLSSRTVNETRGQFTYSNLKAAPSDPLGPAVSISGVAAFGTLSGSPTARVNKLYEIADNFSHQAGAHAFRAGADFLDNGVTITYPRSLRGSYSFSSLANFLQGVYNNSGFTQTFGNPVAAQSNPNVGVYAQDQWKALPRLTLNLGFRYDLQFLPTIRTDRNNVSPRAGFAWSPFASRRMVVRGSYGLFYDRVPLRALANALLSSGNTTSVTGASQVSVSLSPAQTGAPVFPGILSTLPANALVNLTTMSHGMQNAYSQQGSLEIERQVGGKGTLSAGYQHLRGLHLIAAVNQNVPACTAAGNNNGCRPNPNYANDSRYMPLADSHYDGLHVSFLRRPNRWGSYRISYTYSKALNNAGEFFFSSPLDPGNIWRDYGRSDDDQRHRATFDGSLHLPAGFQLSGMLQYYSALPLNILTGATTVQGTSARPTVNGVFIGRNAGTGNDFFNVNARLSRTFAVGERWRVEAIAEAFNALNHRNNLTLNGTFGTGAYPANPSASFGQVTAVNDARSAQLALRVQF